MFKFKENKKAKNNFNSRTYDYYFNQYYIEYVCKNSKNINEAEMKVAKSYTQVEEDDDKTQSDFVKFDAYVLKDLDGDGKAENLEVLVKKLEVKTLCICNLM